MNGGAEARSLTLRPLPSADSPRTMLRGIQTELPGALGRPGSASSYLGPKQVISAF